MKISNAPVIAEDDPRLYENLHVDSDAPVCPTKSTMESLTKARAGVEESKKKCNAITICHLSMVRALRL